MSPANIIDVISPSTGHPSINESNPTQSLTIEHWVFIPIVFTHIG